MTVKSDKKVFSLIIKTSISLLIIIVIATSIAHEIKALTHNLEYYELQDFNKYKKDFTTLSEFFLDCFNSDLKENDNISSIFVSPSVYADNNGNYEVEVTYFYCSSENSPNSFYEKIDQTIKDCFETIRTAFLEKSEGINGTFWGITIYEDFVCFRTYAPYSVIYSANGKRPPFIASPNEDFSSVFIDKISRTWYQAVGT